MNNTESGSALVMVILLSLILSAVGGTMMLMSNADHRIASNERDAERALFAARAGVNYAYGMFRDGSITPSGAGATFDSFVPAVAGPLGGAEFTGRMFDLSGTLGQGQLYRIESTGTFNRASRTTELVFQVVPEAFKYGYMAFNKATLHNHSGLAGPTFRIESTILSNGDVSVPDGLTIDGSIVASGDVSVGSGSIIERDIFANSVDNDGTINGKVALLTSVAGLSSSAATYDRIDAFGNKYAWFNDSSPGSYSGSLPAGGQTSYLVQNNDVFKTDIFNQVGFLIGNPNINVTKYVAPPLINYAAMKAEADLNDPTYFTTAEDAVNYLISKRVDETIGGRAVKTIRVGTPGAPEFLYIADDFHLDIDPFNTDDAASSEIRADALYIEGGMFVAGDWNFDGPNFPAALPAYPAPPDYYMLSINALPYCYPAVLVYEEPTVGTVATWTPSATPPMTGGGPKMDMKGGSEGPSFFNGLVFAEAEIHMHHTDDPMEVIRFNGAELSWNIHNCDYFWFTYDPNIRCTRFLVTNAGSPEVVSYREVR